MTVADGEPASGPFPAGAGPRVLALGGGHGLATTLRALRTFSERIVAVVSVADDGGSSGRLRNDLDIAAPGDLRRCLAALAEPGDPVAANLGYRFPSGDLAGHALGNLLIAGLADALGDFQVALDEVGRRIGAVGRVLPATVEPVVLVGHRPGDIDGGEVEGRKVEGQEAVKLDGGVRRVAVRPAEPGRAEVPVAPAVSDAIAAADLVVLGPGSLYTSILATAVVPAVRTALDATAAVRVHVCNLAAVEPESRGLRAPDHAVALADHGIPIDRTVVDPAVDGVTAVADPVLVTPVANGSGATHDPVALGRVLADLTGGARDRPVGRSVGGRRAEADEAGGEGCGDRLRSGPGHHPPGWAASAGGDAG